MNPRRTPAAHVAEKVVTAPYEDAKAALRAFAEGVDVITYEFENVPAAARPSGKPAADPPQPPGATAVNQDRILEKDFLTGIGLTTALRRRRRRGQP